MKSSVWLKLWLLLLLLLLKVRSLIIITIITIFMWLQQSITFTVNLKDRYVLSHC